MPIVTLQPGQPLQVVYAAAANRTPPIHACVLSNLDTVNPITYGSSQDGQQPDLTEDLTSDILAPQQSIQVNTTLDWWAMCDDGPVQLDVIPEAAAPSPSFLALGEFLVTSGLAVEIAQAIAQAGVSLLAAPQLLYSLPSSTQPGTLVGATIGPQNYPGQSQTQANTTFDGFVARNMAITLQKVYYTEGQSSAVPSNVALDIAQGCSIFASIKPAQTASNTYADATPTRTGGPTCLDEKNKLTAIINNLLAAGLTTSTLKVTLWQEPNTGGSFDTPAHYQNYLNYYLPAVRALGITHVYNPVVGSTPWDGAVNPPTNASFDEVYADYYGSAYNTGFRLDGTGPSDNASLQAVADNHTPSPVPFGIGEFNDVAGSGAGSSSYWANYMGHIQSVFQARVSAAKPLGWLMFWMGNNAQNKPNNQILSGSDFKIPALQTFNDTFGQPSSVLSIAAGQTTTLTPLAPAAGGVTAQAAALSYELTATFIAGIGSTVPFCTVQMQWYPTNNTAAPPIAQQWWSVPMGTNGTTGTVIYGRGPMYGAFLRIKVHNLDSVACTMTFQMNSNGRLISRDDWNWDVGSSVSVPTFTIAGSTATAGNQIGLMDSVTVPANGSVSRLCGLFSGPVSIRFSDSSGAGKLSFAIAPQPSTRWGTVSLINETPGGEAIISPFYLPRGPLLVTVTNSDAVQHNCNLEITSYD